MGMRRSRLSVLAVWVVTLVGVSTAFAEVSVSNTLTRLGADSFQDREKASAALTGLLKANADHLIVVREYYQATDDPEVRHRIEEAAIGGVDESVLNPPAGALGLNYFKCGDDKPEGGRIHGFRVSHVVGGRAAENAGIDVGDLVIAFDDWTLNEASRVGEIPAFMSTRYAGQALRLRVIRDGKTRDVGTTLTVRAGHLQLGASEFRVEMLRWLMSSDELPGKPR